MTGGRPSVTILSQHYWPEPSGNAPYVTSLANGLAERGFRVRVVTTHPHYPDWRIREGYGGWTRREQGGRVEIRRLRHYVPRRPHGARRLLAEVSFGVRAALHPWGRPDIIIAVSPALFGSIPVLLRARFSFARPVRVLWVQDLYSLGVRELDHGGSKVGGVVSRAEAAALRLADGVAVIHDRFARQASDVLGVDKARVEVIRNWAHVSEPATSNAAGTRRRLGWNATTVALHAGNMGVKQALENIVEAARLADAQDASVKFVLLGNGSRRADLERRAAGIRSIEFLDPVADDEFLDILSAADVLLVNEKAELREMAVPSKLTSYFSTGRPVVAATDSDSVTAAEVAASGGGIRVDAGDPPALLAAVVQVASSPELSERLGKAGLRYRASVLGKDEAIDHYAAWLSTMVAGRTRSSHGPERVGL